MAKSLPVKYRPKTFADVCAQESVIRILERQCETKQFKNNYLISGPSGVGKTTLARILAKKINEFELQGQTHSAEPIEIDAASNNGVDNVRAIIESAHQRSLSGEYKVYIIDECHILTTQAWNALLKTIEETPEYTIFMFCTTEYNKVPETIRNRCQQYFLARVPNKEITNRLRYICQNEGFTFEESGLDHITKLSNGSVRQAIAHLEFCSSYSTNISLENVLKVLGDFSYDTYFKVMNSIIDKDNSTLLTTIESLFTEGKDLKLFIDMFIDFVLDLSKYSLFKSFDIIKIPAECKAQLDYVVNLDGATKYFNHILDKLLEIKTLLKGDTQPKNTVEIALLQL